MKLPRRRLLHLAASAALLPAASRSALAFDYPTRPVRLIVGFFAGGLSDILARLLSPRLSERLGQQFIVEDQPGAGTNLAAEAVVRAPPDGYTLLLATSANAINATLYDNLKFNFIRDTAPVASIARTPHVMVINPSFPAETVLDFIAYAKANPGKINMATSGIGSPVHLAGELFMMMTGVQLVTVHYRSSYVPDMLSGQVQLVFQPHTHDDPAGPSWQVTRPCSDQRDTFAGAARASDDRRVCTGLRGQHVERRSRAEEHDPSDHGTALQRDRCGARRSRNNGALRRRRQRSKIDVSRRLRQIHC
jgi:hypothetical protein